MIATAIAASLVMASAAVAQEASVPAPPSERLLAGGRNPVVSYLMQAYGISETEAQERLAVQNEVMELAARLEKEDPAYADIWIEHQPVYKVVIAFTDKADRQAFKAGLSPRLRRYVQLRPVTNSRKQRQRQLEEISAILRSAGVPFDGWFEGPRQRFSIGVTSAADLSRAESLLPPNLRAQVDLAVRRIARPEAGPTGVVAGDWIAGGFAVWITSDPAHPNPTQCTFGFPVRYGANRLPGVLTAAHCTEPTPPMFAARFGNPAHFIKFDFANPIIRRRTGQYDYMVLQGSSSLNDDGLYDVYFQNPNNQVPGVTGNWLDIYAYAARTSMAVGNAVCKSGDTTKLTCGTIRAMDGASLGYAGYIVVSNTAQPDLSAPGDSGGPWFFNPGTGSKAIAIGIHTSGTEGCVGAGWACNAFVMPIEYIDDHDPTIKLPSTP